MDIDISQSLLWRCEALVSGSCHLDKSLPCCYPIAFFRLLVAFWVYCFEENVYSSLFLPRYYYYGGIDYSFSLLARKTRRFQNHTKSLSSLFLVSPSLVLLSFHSWRLYIALLRFTFKGFAVMSLFVIEKCQVLIGN